MCVYRKKKKVLQRTSFSSSALCKVEWCKRIVITVNDTKTKADVRLIPS